MNIPLAGRSEIPSADSQSQKRSQAEEKYVILNIGGTKFYTSTVTLLTEPDSMLGVMFSGRYPLAPASADGR